MAKTTTEIERHNLELVRAFDALMSTAAVESQIEALLSSGAEVKTLNAALTDALNVAVQRWGLGLHHLKHAAQWKEAETGGDIVLLTDKQVTAHMSAGVSAVAAGYAPLLALDERGLSAWGALPEGHRVGPEVSSAQLKVLIEDARDFETHWMSMRGGLFQRLWRNNTALYLEVSRPASAQTALADAAWDVIASIKDRAFQRELMKRSESVGMLGALLGARHSEARANLERLPEAYFCVQSVVYTLKGNDGRSVDHYKQQLKNASAELEEYQALVTQQLSQVLRHGLKE